MLWWQQMAQLEFYMLKLTLLYQHIQLLEFCEYTANVWPYLLQSVTNAYTRVQTKLSS